MTDFYKQGGSYFDATTNKKILNTAELQSYSKAGGKEIATPTPKAGSVAIPNAEAVKDYTVTNQIGGTLFGSLKTPTSSDITTGLNAGSVKPPQGTADLIHQTFADNASQYSQSQKDLIAIRESQLAETQKQMTDTNKQIADNQIKIEQNKTDIKNVETGSMDDPNLQGWRQSALGITSEDLKTKYEDYKTEYSSRKSMGDELATLATMYANELAKPQPVAIASVANGRLNNTKEQYVGRISALQAGISAIDGNISMAQTFIDRGIETVNADRTDRLEYLNFIKGLNSTEGTDLKNKLLNLTEEEQTTIDNEIKIITDKIAETETNKKFMQTLFTDTQTAQTAIKSGVNLTDTPDQAVKKMADYMKAHPSEFDSGKVIFGIIGQDENGNNIYGFIDTGTKTINGQTANGTNNTSSGGIVKTSTGDAYDIGSYATDPNHETSIQNILNNIGQFKSVSDIDAYIKKIAPNSPITGDMVKSAADKYGVSWEMMVAIMQQDSTLGTEGKGARTYNPGNVGNTDSGTEVNYKTWQAGVDAVAKNLAWRKTNSEKQISDITKRAIEDPDYYKNLDTKLQKKVDIEVANNGLERKLISDTDLVAYAQEFASTGKVPTGLPAGTFGKVTEAAKKLPKNEGAIIDVTTGLTPDSSKVSNANKDGLLALNDVNNKIQLLRERFTNIAATGVVAGLWSKVWPTKDQTAFNNLRDEIVDLIARARTGAVINEEEAKTYQAKLPSTFNEWGLWFGKDGKQMINDFETSIGGTLDTKLKGFGIDIIGREMTINGKQMKRAYKDGQWGWED